MTSCLGGKNGEAESFIEIFIMSKLPAAKLVFETLLHRLHLQTIMICGFLHKSSVAGIWAAEIPMTTRICRLKAAARIDWIVSAEDPCTSLKVPVFRSSSNISS